MNPIQYGLCSGRRAESMPGFFSTVLAASPSWRDSNRFAASIGYNCLSANDDGSPPANRLGPPGFWRSGVPDRIITAEIERPRPSSWRYPSPSGKRMISRVRSHFLRPAAFGCLAWEHLAPLDSSIQGASRYKFPINMGYFSMPCRRHYSCRIQKLTIA